MLAEAWQAMGANRLRTFLTMLGMVIGVGAVILMLAVGQGAQQFAVDKVFEQYWIPALDALEGMLG